MEKNRSTTTNKVLPKAGLNGFDWTFVQGSTVVILLNFCAKNPAFGNTQNVTCHLKMKHNLHLIFLCLLITGCSKPEQVKELPTVTKGLYRYSLDTNFFKVIEVKNQRDELVILNAAGEKEASYTYDNYGLVWARNFENNIITRERHFVNIDSLNSSRVIDTRFFPNRSGGAFTNGYLIDKQTKSINDNSPSDYFYLINPVDTLVEGEVYNLIIDTKNIKGKKPNSIPIKKIVYDLNENFAYTDEKQIKIKKLSSDTINYSLETKTPGVNYKRLILFLLEKDSGTNKVNDEVQSFMFEHRYYVRPKNEIGPYLDNFREIFKERIINDR